MGLLRDYVSLINWLIIKIMLVIQIQEFLRKQYSQENVNFWISCENFKLVSDQQVYRINSINSYKFLILNFQEVPSSFGYLWTLLCLRLQWTNQCGCCCAAVHFRMRQIPKCRSDSLQSSSVSSENQILKSCKTYPTLFFLDLSSHEVRLLSTLPEIGRLPQMLGKCGKGVRTARNAGAFHETGRCRIKLGRDTFRNLLILFCNTVVLAMKNKTLRRKLHNNILICISSFLPWRETVARVVVNNARRRKSRPDVDHACLGAQKWRKVPVVEAKRVAELVLVMQRKIRRAIQKRRPWHAWVTLAASESRTGRAASNSRFLLRWNLSIFGLFSFKTFKMWVTNIQEIEKNWDFSIWRF